MSSLMNHFFIMRSTLITSRSSNNDINSINIDTNTNYINSDEDNNITNIISTLEKAEIVNSK
jgi:hypothetical protein